MGHVLQIQQQELLFYDVPTHLQPTTTHEQHKTMVRVHLLSHDVPIRSQPTTTPMLLSTMVRVRCRQRQQQQEQL